VIAVYAGSFDPVTLGHLSVIRRAARLFAHLRVLVAVNPEKEGVFSHEERVELVRELTRVLPNVSVEATAGLVVEHAREIGAAYLVRGIRGSGDAAIETSLAFANGQLAPELVTVFFPADPALAEVSSSLLRERAKSGEDLTGMCPLLVARALEARLGGSA